MTRNAANEAQSTADALEHKADRVRAAGQQGGVQQKRPKSMGRPKRALFMPDIGLHVRSDGDGIDVNRREPRMPSLTDQGSECMS